MKIPEKIIERLCQRILQNLKDKHLIQIKVPESQVLARMIKAMQDDLKKDAELDAEIRKMMEKFQDQIDRGEVDEQKMYQMIKKQLIKERNIVL